MANEEEILSYTQLGYDPFLRRQFVAPSIGQPTGGGGGGGGGFLLDQMAYSTNLGTVINVGGNKVRIDGSKGRIVISDEENERTWIGNIGE